MTRDYEEIAKIIDPEDGALNYIARKKAKQILKLGYRKDIDIPKVYAIEKMIYKVKSKNGDIGVMKLAREIHKKLNKIV